MKFTVTFVTLLSISSIVVLAEETKDKREAPSSYSPSSSSGYPSNYQSPLSHGDANSISVGAGYSIGGAKPSFSFAGQGSLPALQLSSANLQAGHGGSYQLPPITLQPNQDINELMSQISKSLGSGALSLQPSNTVAEFHESQGQSQGAQEYSFPQFQQYVAPKVQQQYALAGQISSEPSYAAGTKGLSSYGSTGPVLFNPDQSIKQPAFGYVAPSAAHSASNVESLSLGSGQSLSGSSGHSLGGSALNLGSSGQSLAGLGHSLGFSGLSFDGSGFTLGGAGYSSDGAGQSLGGSGYSTIGAGQSLGGSGYPSIGAGQSLGGSGYSLGSLSSLGQSQGESGHSLGGISGASGHSFEGSGSSGLSLGSSLGADTSGHALSSAGYSLGGSGHSFGGALSSPSKHYKVLSSGGHISSSKTAFKPSTFLGVSIPNESGSSASHSSYPGYSSSSLGASHGALSFGSHGPSFGSFGGYGGSSKGISPLYTKLEGSSLDSSGAYTSAGHLSSPPGTSYGFPTSSYSGAVHASSSGPQYYVSSSKYPSSFGGSSSSFRGPSSSYSSLSSHSLGPKYSFGGRSSSSHYSPKDSDGAYSETSYNTIKYSEELKPRAH